MTRLNSISKQWRLCNFVALMLAISSAVGAESNRFVVSGDQSACFFVMHPPLANRLGHGVAYEVKTDENIKALWRVTGWYSDSDRVFISRNGRYLVRLMPLPEYLPENRRPELSEEFVIAFYADGKLIKKHRCKEFVQNMTDGVKHYPYPDKRGMEFVLWEKNWTPHIHNDQIYLAEYEDSIANSWLIGTGNIRDYKSFVRKLRERTEGVSTYLANHFSHDGLRTILDINSSENLVKATLVSELNDILRGPIIYEEGRFSKVQLSDFSKAAISPQSSKNGNIPEFTGLVNRVLLREAYPLELTDEASMVFILETIEYNRFVFDLKTGEVIHKVKIPFEKHNFK